MRGCTRRDRYLRLCLDESEQGAIAGGSEKSFPKPETEQVFDRRIRSDRASHRRWQSQLGAFPKGFAPIRRMRSNPNFRPKGRKGLKIGLGQTNQRVSTVDIIVQNVENAVFLACFRHIVPLPESMEQPWLPKCRSRS
jgi:hypothetical protein